MLLWLLLLLLGGTGVAGRLVGWLVGISGLRSGALLTILVFAPNSGGCWPAISQQI